jgi:IS4 transposase
MVADREADIFDLFASPRRAGAELLIRASQNRRVEDAAGTVWAAIRQVPAQGVHMVTVRRNKDQPPRQAQMTLRWTTLRVRPPKARALALQGPAIPLQLILAQEVAPPSDVPPICWLLVTTLPVHTFADAVQCVQWYTQRWLIERYHYVLKSGCKVERLQLASADRLERALATYSIVAWRLLWLTYMARHHPDTPAQTIFDPHEWRALGTLLRPPVGTARCVTIRTAIRAIAQLGGFLARHSDGEPGQTSS